MRIFPSRSSEGGMARAKATGKGRRPVWYRRRCPTSVDWKVC